MSYKIKNLYIGRYENGPLLIKDMIPDQELLTANKINFKTTYDIRENLKSYGFKFNQRKREWILDSEDMSILEDLKSKYLVEREPYEIKFKKQCEMCGSYFYTVCC